MLTIKQKNMDPYQRIEEMSGLNFFSFTVSQPTGDESLHFWQAVIPWIDWRSCGPDMRAGLKKRYRPYVYGAGFLLGVFFISRLTGK